MEPGSKSPEKRCIDVTRLLNRMRLETAMHLLRSGRGAFDADAVAAMIADYRSQAGRLHAAGEIGEARRLARRAFALSGLLAHGPDPARTLAEVELPQGYCGKILLVGITGGGFEGLVCLRSGDGWHREILNNTRAEIKDLGFVNARADPLGGAHARFEPDGGIVVWGISDEYGACDKQAAAALIARAYRRLPVKVEA